MGPQFNPVMEQFQNEIDVLMRLQQTARHPNIIHLEDVYITNSVIYMIMEYMRGGEVHTMLEPSHVYGIFSVTLFSTVPI